MMKSIRNRCEKWQFLMAWRSQYPQQHQLQSLHLYLGDAHMPEGCHTILIILRIMVEVLQFHVWHLFQDLEDPLLVM